MRIIISCFILSAIVASCYYDSEEYLYPQISQTCDTANVTYNASIATILNSCTTCHYKGTSLQTGGGISLADYNDVKIKVDDGHLWGAAAHLNGYKWMPPEGKLDDCSLLKIQTWINKGAPEN
jgi:cytochrome c5